MTERTAEPSAGLSGEEVAAYLEAHPGFFEGREKLLEKMRIPHATGGAVSLVERQVQSLRGRNEELQQHLRRLTQAARNNEVLLERLQVLILELIASRHIDEVLSALEKGLREDFGADFFALRLFGEWDRPEAVEPTVHELASFDKALNRGEPVCGYITPEQKRFLFGDDADEVASAILLPLCESARTGCLGLLGLGSTDSKRFHSEMGTVFVSHLGAVAARILRAHLEAL